MKQEKQIKRDKLQSERRPKKGKRSTRNRHTGFINAFKKMCIEQGKRFIHRGNMYALYQHPPKKIFTPTGIVMQRAGTTLVRVHE